MELAAVAALAKLESGSPAAMLMCDIDFFKSVNDQYGHDVGDAVLRGVADEIRARVPCRPAIFGRHGGEEFAVLLPGVDEAEACGIAEAIRRACATRVLALAGPKALKVTLSIGVAALQNQKDLRRLLARADFALYRAKAAGRNRVMNSLAAVQEQLAV
jgi:diguanylate cyclase (GGDEF)-like protein